MEGGFFLVRLVMPNISYGPSRRTGVGEYLQDNTNFGITLVTRKSV